MGAKRRRIDPDGTRRSKRIGSKSMAGKFARKPDGQLAAETYPTENRRLWSDFWAEYEGRMGPPRVNPQTWRIIRKVLNCRKLLQGLCLESEAGAARTRDLRIKSPLLYHLSYSL
jgi:hypothetical protein